MNEQIKTTTIDQLPEATSLDGLYVFGYSPKNAVGKRSVKTPINLLKGNQGDAPIIGANGNWWIGGKDTGKPARGQDGEVTTVQLKEAFGSVENLASATNNGLMSIEHFNFIEDMATNMQYLIDAVKASSEKDEDKFDTMAVLAFTNDAPTKLSRLFRLRNGVGAMALKIKGKEYSSPTETIVDVKGSAMISDILLANANDVVSVYFTGADAFAIPNMETDKLTHISLFDPKKKLIGFTCNSTKLLSFDLSGAKGITSIYCQQMPNLEMLSLGENIALVNLIAFQNTKLKSVILAGGYLKEVRLYSCTLLTDLTVSNDMPDLTTLDLKKTAINKSTLMLIETKWLSRVGKTAGSLKVSKILYDELTDEEKLLFVNKNITIQFE